MKLLDGVGAESRNKMAGFDPNQPRNEDGEWSKAEASARKAAKVLGKPKRFDYENYDPFSRTTAYESYDYAQDLSKDEIIFADKQRKAYEFYFRGEQIGEVSNYRGSIDTKTAGRRYVDSRRDAERWSATIFGGFHRRSKRYSRELETGSVSEDGFRSRKEAMDWIAKNHLATLKGN